MTTRDKAEQAMTEYLQDGARKVAGYLATFPHVFDVKPVIVVIRGAHYSAARYMQRCTVPEGSRAWHEGERREYTRETIYAVGRLPACYVRSTHKAFVIDGDAREWFVAGYSGIVTKRVQANWPPSEFHPFGNSFMLSPWDIEGKIDSYARTPYERVPMILREG